MGVFGFNGFKRRFKKSNGSNNVPHTFLVNAEGEIVYSHNNYAPGDEDVLYDEILKISNK